MKCPLLPAAFLAIVWSACVAAEVPGDPLPLALPAVGTSELRVLSPTVLEATIVTSPAPGVVPPVPTSAQNECVVTLDGRRLAVARSGFKRRAIYAPLQQRDLRVANALYLELAEPLPADAARTLEVTRFPNPLWPPETVLRATTSAMRYSPAIHVNQEGYEPDLPKVAIVGYYLGSLGELHVPASDFELIDNTTGKRVFRGELRPRRDVGYTYTPRPYQAVREAIFSDFKEPGEYRVVVPGLGASLPFRIGDGEMMNFVRTYALGLYHQRCGTTNELPFSRFTHDACHLAPADVPVPQSSFAKTWNLIARANSDGLKPDHPAAVLKTESSQLYPFIRRGKIDVSGGHHDAGDYSKYTINSAALIHALVFAVDSFPGVAELDNLGLPESGDGISDLLQEAKWEADFLAKMQDTDGGFYFLVYPRDRPYESGVTPDQGDAQVVWPKNTSATAAAVAALAQCSSSPEFKRRYPEDARRYFAQAQLGWKFLLEAIARHGKAGAYQKLTHYGDTFRHDDELAWAACEMFVATGDAAYRDKLFEWYPDPTAGSTHFWGWWRAAFAYGNALRSYAFAARSGRLREDQLDAVYLAKCAGELRRAGDDATRWSQQNAYGTSFPDATKRQLAGGWYFSSDQAFDITVAYQLNPRAAFAEAVVSNLDFEAGCNPVNVSFITGLGVTRPREVVHQFAQADRRVLPPSGLPLGSLQASFDYLAPYQNQLRELTYPADDAKIGPYPLYDRWSDAFNVTTEFVIGNQARSLASLAFWAARTPAKSAPWRAVRAFISAPGVAGTRDGPLTFRLTAGDLDLADARIVWEARDSDPVVAPQFSYTPKNVGAQWVEAEAQFPDGRRVFAANNFTSSQPVVFWVDGALPAGASGSTTGGDEWTWQRAGSKPAELRDRDTPQHLSAGTEPLHEHTFVGVANPLPIEDGDVLFAWVFPDRKNPPREIMLSWNDGTWEHRAAWGENLIPYGQYNSPGHRPMGPLPRPGEWTRLEIPARLVGLEGRALQGMSFSVYGGRVIWDAAGKTSGSAKN
jgi:hypothetical protein